MTIKIVSGGQTGADRGALDAALKSNVDCGGWCPAGRLAEDGEIPARYPMQEIGEASYSGRTLKNVIDSDGTVIFFFGKLEGGSRLTAVCCRKERKPYLLVDAIDFDPQQAAAMVEDFIKENGIEVLNVAGPRDSKQPRAYDYTLETLSRLLNRLP